MFILSTIVLMPDGIIVHSMLIFLYAATIDSLSADKMYPL